MYIYKSTAHSDGDVSQTLKADAYASQGSQEIRNEKDYRRRVSSWPELQKKKIKTHSLCAPSPHLPRGRGNFFLCGGVQNILFHKCFFLYSFPLSPLRQKKIKRLSDCWGLGDIRHERFWDRATTAWSWSQGFFILFLFLHKNFIPLSLSLCLFSH